MTEIIKDEAELQRLECSGHGAYGRERMAATIRALWKERGIIIINEWRRGLPRFSAIDPASEDRPHTATTPKDSDK